MDPNQLLVLGVGGSELTPEEGALYRQLQPGGFILFTRNLVDAAQTRKLTDDLRDLSTTPPFIAIDNEGGRVWRTAQFSPPPPPQINFAARTIRSSSPKLAGRPANSSVCWESTSISLRFSTLITTPKPPTPSADVAGATPIRRSSIMLESSIVGSAGSASWAAPNISPREAAQSPIPTMNCPSSTWISRNYSSTT
jgi:hypothetical protein